MWIAWWMGCLDYQLGGKTDVGSGTTTATTATTATTPQTVTVGECTLATPGPEKVGFGDRCTFDVGEFNPVIEWTAGSGKYMWSQPIVGDLDGDGLPEVVANFAGLFGTGDLVVLRGDGSGTWWEDTSANLGYADSPAIGDLDGDGSPDIVAVREYENSLLGVGDYTVVAWEADGRFKWESEHFEGLDFDYATALALADLDADGSVEVVAGRVILDGATGLTRGVGAYGRGSWGVTTLFGYTLSEATVPAVADIDLDGIQEVIVGDAIYDADGNALWNDPSQDDGMIAVANLDDDPQAEWVASSYNTVRAVDDDGSLLWGPLTIPSANIVSPAAIGDVDADGLPEIVVAGGNDLYVLERDGTTLWTARVTDMTGATGASIHDFDGDGIPEVVYIDEVEMAAYDGLTGAVKFLTNDHVSNTMMDCPTIADVDADGEAEILVANAGSASALSVYGDRDGTWTPARKLWNQNGYSITNINDDLSVPTNPVQNFTIYNNYRAALDLPPGASLDQDLEGEIVDVCDDTCDSGAVFVSVRVLNRAEVEAPAGIPVTVYGSFDTGPAPMATITTPDPIPPGWTSDSLILEVHPLLAAEALDMFIQVDDDGTGTGVLAECAEDNNDFTWLGPFCE